MKYWDLYDEKLQKTDIKISEKEKVPEGLYHISLDIWIINKKSEVLITKNPIDYSMRYPDSWCCLTGNLETSETTEDAIKRIINDYLRCDINIKTAIILEPIKRDPYKYAYITCILFDDVDINKINLNNNISKKIVYVDKKELLNMCDNGEISYYLIGRIKNHLLNYIK